ncbi:DUF1573 domain-containing protein [bacterium]|nr:DUF1573 domain-containing protein [bacterium]
MKQIYCLLLTTCYLLLLSRPVPAQATAQGSADAPDIRLEEEAFNFGIIQEGEKAHHKFIISNKGNKELIIEKVRTTCGCTSSMLGSKNVPAGGTTEVELIYDSKGRPGGFSKTAYIHSNDPDEPQKKLVISGDVKKKLEPAKISLEESVDVGVIEAGRPNRIELKIANTGGQDLIITQIKEGRFTTTGDSPPTIAGGSSYNLSLSISSPKKGVLSDTIAIISNAGRKEVAISGYLLEGSRGILISNWSKNSLHQLRIKNEAFPKIKLLGIEGPASLSKEEIGEGEEAVLKLAPPKDGREAELILKIAIPYEGIKKTEGK